MKKSSKTSRKRKKSVIWAALFCAGCIVMSSCHPARPGGEVSRTDVSAPEVSSEEGYQSPYHGELGSAGSLSGKTAVISIFTDEAETSWNYESAEDGRMIDDTLENLGIATEYLTEQAARFGSDAAFV